MTWNALTFTSSHILTASDMNRIQDNFTALAQGHSGAPAIGVNSFMVTGVASVATLNISSEALIGGSQIQFKNEKAQADGYAGLDADGRVPTSQAGVPTGAVLPYVATTAPTGWLLCDGDTIGAVASGADHEDAGYEDLFNLLKDMTPNAGTEVWANGDTVKLPDLRGRVVIALDDLGGTSAARIAGASIPNRSSDTWDETLGGSAGDDPHTLTESELASHRHTRLGCPNQTAGSAWVGKGGTGFNHTRQTNYTGGDGSHNNMQPSMALGYIIKT